jgi:hypothetical protein
VTVEKVRLLVASEGAHTDEAVAASGDEEPARRVESRERDVAPMGGDRFFGPRFQIEGRESDLTPPSEAGITV